MRLKLKANDVSTILLNMSTVTDYEMTETDIGVIAAHIQVHEDDLVSWAATTRLRNNEFAMIVRADIQAVRDMIAEHVQTIVDTVKMTSSRANMDLRRGKRKQWYQ